MLEEEMKKLDECDVEEFGRLESMYGENDRYLRK